MTKKLLDILPERKSDLVTLPSGIVVRDKTFSGTARFCWNPDCNYLVGIARSACGTCGWTAKGPRQSSILGELVQPRPRAKGKTDKPQNEKLNKTEARYANHLEKLKMAGEVLWYRNHAFGLYFEDGTRYTPDFMVMDKDGGITLIDCKAYYKNKGKAHIEPDSMLRMKRTAHEYWMFTVKATWEVDGQWQEMTF